MFGAKIGMALYREYVGVALPLESEVLVTWSLNVGFRSEVEERMLNSLPGLGRIEQGKKTLRASSNIASEPTGNKHLSR